MRAARLRLALFVAFGVAALVLEFAAPGQGSDPFARVDDDDVGAAPVLPR